MLQTQLAKMAKYNEWAWSRVFPCVEQLDDAAYRAEQGFFWGSVHGVLVHAYVADWIWLSRLQGNSPDYMPTADQFADYAALRTKWDPLRQRVSEFVAECSEQDLARPNVYHTTKGQRFEQTVADTLQHLFNHATEHRSQLTPVLYQLGVPTEPLDYIYFARS